jgi:hypothetical protein
MVEISRSGIRCRRALARDGSRPTEDDVTPQGAFTMTRIPRSTRNAHRSAADEERDAVRQAVQEALDRRDNGGETGHNPGRGVGYGR